MTETTDGQLKCSQCGAPFPDPISARDSDVQEFICACSKGKVTYGPLHRADRIVMLNDGTMQWASWGPEDASDFYYIDCHAGNWPPITQAAGLVIG